MAELPVPSWRYRQSLLPKIGKSNGKVRAISGAAIVAVLRAIPTQSSVPVFELHSPVVSELWSQSVADTLLAALEPLPPRHLRVKLWMGLTFRRLYTEHTSGKHACWDASAEMVSEALDFIAVQLVGVKELDKLPKRATLLRYVLQWCPWMGRVGDAMAR